MLHRRPDLFQIESVLDETDFVTMPSSYVHWIKGGSLVANPLWQDDTRTGAYTQAATEGKDLTSCPNKCHDSFLF